MTDEIDDTTKAQLEVWKTTIGVQQHFNDIEMKVRGLALTVLTATLGAAAVAVRDGTVIEVFGVGIKLGAAVLGAGLIAWGGFYFVDQIWYHRLLIGAVDHAQKIEDLLEEKMPGAGLTHSIREASPYPGQIGVWGVKITYTLHSRHKLSVFYGLVAAVLIVLAVGIQLGNPPITDESRLTDADANEESSTGEGSVGRGSWGV